MTTGSKRRCAQRCSENSRTGRPSAFAAPAILDEVPLLIDGMRTDHRAALVRDGRDAGTSFTVR